MYGKSPFVSSGFLISEIFQLKYLQLYCIGFTVEKREHTNYQTKNPLNLFSPCDSYSTWKKLSERYTGFEDKIQAVCHFTILSLFCLHSKSTTVFSADNRVLQKHPITLLRDQLKLHCFCSTLNNTHSLRHCELRPKCKFRNTFRNIEFIRYNIKELFHKHLTLQLDSFSSFIPLFSIKVEDLLKQSQNNLSNGSANTCMFAKFMKL